MQLDLCYINHMVKKMGLLWEHDTEGVQDDTDSITGLKPSLSLVMTNDSPAPSTDDHNSVHRVLLNIYVPISSCSSEAANHGIRLQTKL